MTTELAFLPVGIGSTISDPSTPPGKIWHNALLAVSRQPKFQQYYWGFQVKHPDILQLVVEFDSSGPHSSFTGSQAFFQSITSLLKGPPEFYTAHLSPHPSPALKSPATEVVMINNPFPDFNESLAQFGVNVLSKSDGHIDGVSVGPIEGESQGVKRVYLLVGWETVQKQKDMMTTDIFKANVGLVKDHCESLALDYVEFKSSSS
ncbi:hypothetical protein CLAIMM_04359 [Cladophialophora immunda]|nr:hypothetical protein CLAIMM_04359 [Cladophialophora immunda]